MKQKKFNHLKFHYGEKIAIFEGKKIRRHWDEKAEKWYFPVINIVAILTEQTNFKRAQSYWTTLKKSPKTWGKRVCHKM